MADADKFVIVNARFPPALVQQLDAYVELLKARTPGLNPTRSDVLRIAVEELTKGAVLEASAAKPTKKAAGRR
jgi:hypothetical protein